MPDVFTHTQLDCGIEFLAERMPGFNTATLVLRIQGGMSAEPAEMQGLAYVIEQTLDKGNASLDAREFANAVDAIGADYSIHTGRESWIIVISALPEFMPRAISLIGQTIVSPRFPEHMVDTARSLSLQELVGLEDAPRGLLRRAMSLKAYGPVLGRHPLGREDALNAIDSKAPGRLWDRARQRGAICAAIAGNFSIEAVRDALESALTGVPPGEGIAPVPRHPFVGGTEHLTKALEQTQIGISFPGVHYDDPAYPVEKVLLGILSGGMGARLFSEVREKRGLVYWVSAWHEQLVNAGMIHLGAATTAERCEETFTTLLAEVARLSDDLNQDEIERAINGIVAEDVTVGASPRRHVSDLIANFVHLGKIIAPDISLNAVRAVRVDDIKRYLETHPRSPLAIVSVGSQTPNLRAPHQVS